MKKISIISILLCLCLTVGLLFTACGESSGDTDQKKEESEAVTIDLGSSSLYTKEELDAAVTLIRSGFAELKGCELHSITYAGDEAATEENLEWLNGLKPGAKYTQVAEFLMDFHTPKDDANSVLLPDCEYSNYEWWLARTADGSWEIVTFGY